MKAVIDTNVVAYHLLGAESFADEAGVFLRSVGEAFAPASWAAKLANVVWMAVRGGVIPKREASRRLYLASRLQVRSVSVRLLWRGALARSIESNLAVSDTLFVELAMRRRLPLVTFDRKLLRTFPNLARRPVEFSKR